MTTKTFLILALTTCIILAGIIIYNMNKAYDINLSGKVRENQALKDSIASLSIKIKSLELSQKSHEQAADTESEKRKDHHNKRHAKKDSLDRIPVNDKYELLRARLNGN